jgi:peptidyl-prolyl cis-trans isomerase A (cyclophilin A)
MTLRFARLALLAPLAALFLTQPVAAQKAETTPAGEAKVALDTSAGRIVLALDPVHAPVTTANFLKYVDGGRFNGESFYRAMKFGDGGLIQAGETGIKHVAGTVAMANLGPGTARADFFILTSDAPSFNDTFAAFGKVVEGMDVAKSILASPVSATKGEGIMRGQMLDPVVKITKASRLAN